VDDAASISSQIINEKEKEWGLYVVVIAKGGMGNAHPTS